MRDEADWINLQQENRELREQVAQRDGLVNQLEQTLAQLTQQMQQTSTQLSQEVQSLKREIKGLQDRLSKDSHNSHIPPSSDRFARQKKTKSLRQPSEKKPGAQSGHEGNTLTLVKDPDHIVSYEVETCSCCEHDLRDVAAHFIERRQVVDVPPKRWVVIEHRTEQKVCPHCQTITRTTFPAGISAPVHYGPAIGAIGVYLTQQQFLPYERACETIQDLLGPAMTVGTLKALVERCADHLGPIEEQIKEQLRKAEVLHEDETGTYVMGKRWWSHVAATEQLTHYAVHAKRGHEALEAIGILPGFTGVSVHDGWATYWKYTTCQHALCNVHHLRELVFLHEQQQQAWAGSMKTLLSDMNTAVKEARERGLKQLDPTEVADWKAQYQTLLQEGYQANPNAPPPIDDTSKRGRRKQSATRNLLDRLSKHQEAVLRFLECFSVPFDNSQAERDIRMVKVQQKISGGFRSLPGAEAFFRIRGYLSTLRKQGAHVLTALELALAGHPVSPAFSCISN